VARPRPSLHGLRPYLHAVVLGTAIALFSLAFLAAMVWLQTLLFRTLPERLDVREPLWILAVCVTGGLLVGVLNRSIERGRDTAHDVDEAIADSHAAAEGADQSPRVFFGRVGLGVVSLGFGGALGPEAPLIAYVSVLGARVGRVLRITRDDSIQLSVAAALGGLFATPLAASASLDLDGEGAVARGRLQRLAPSIVAALAGLLVVRHLIPESAFHPFEASPGDVPAGIGTGLLAAGVVSIAAALLIRVTIELIAPARALVVGRVSGGPIAHGLLGGIALGIVGAITPLELFSGHHETQQLIDEAGSRGSGSLLALALVKVLLLVVLLACGYFGGQIFPMGFAGGALALAIGQMLGFDSTITLVAAGFVAGSAVGVRRPVFTLLLMILFFPSGVWPAMALATGAAALVLAWWPAPPPQHH
jgi:H+/Cl- antiporter ClcA